MAITYTWKVTGLKVKDEVVDGTTYKQAVCQTYWQKIGTDENGNEGTFSGATPFTVDASDDSGPYIEFADLTEEDVLTWIKSIVVGGYEEHVNGKIQEQIDQKINPVTEATMPWAPAANTDATPV